MMKYDMHCHTRAGSIDAKVSTERYIEILRSHGFSGMMITDHDTYRGYRKWLNSQTADPAPDGEKPFFVLAGLEYDTRDAGHFLVILPEGIRPKILHLRGMSAELLIEIVHHYGGILGPAHPFGIRSASAMFHRKFKRRPDLLEKMDFIEGFNTCESEQANRLAQKLARKLGKPALGGSDSHSEDCVGKGYTLFDRPITNNDELIQAIREHQVAGCGGQIRGTCTKSQIKDAFYSVWGFKAYNRTVGAMVAPVRNYKTRRIPRQTKHAAMGATARGSGGMK